MIRRNIEKSLRNMFERGYKQGYEDALKENALKRNKGEWIADVDKWGDVVTTVNGYTCSKCGTFNSDKDNFCPNCGADMRGKAEEEKEPPIFIDSAPLKDCKNKAESYGEICVRCNKCGRFGKEKE
jgi:hypothetical protein